MALCVGIYILCAGGLDLETTKELLLGIVTGAFISVVIALVSYFHEREILIAKAASLSLSVYYDLSILEKLIRYVLLQLGSTAPIQDSAFRNVSSIAQASAEVYNDTSEDLYAPFCRKSTLSKNYAAFTSFRPILQNIARIAQSIESLALQMKLTSLQMGATWQSGQQLPESLSSLSSTQEKTLLVRVSKLHEHVTDRKNSYAEIAEYFFTRTHKDDTWKNTTKNIDSEIDEIIANFTMQTAD